MKQFDVDVVVVGGGIIGRCSAVLFGRLGLKVVLVEVEPSASKAEARQKDPRILAINIASRRILQASGAWEQIDSARIGILKMMQAWDRHGKIEFDSSQLGESELGYVVPYPSLQSGLGKPLAANATIRQLTVSSVEAVEQATGGVLVKFTDSEPLLARLLVWTTESQTPSSLNSGIEQDYLQTAITCEVETAQSHYQVARQRFLPKGPLAFLPMAESHRCAVIWSTTPQQAGELLQSSEADFEGKLSLAFSAQTGALKLLSGRNGFRLSGYSAAQYYQQSQVLVGDAAHRFHPLAGQGANMGFLDVAVLVEVVEQALSEERDIGSLRVLAKYQRWRQHQNRLMLRVLEGFKYGFESQQSYLVEARNIGLNLVNRLPFFKHMIMRYASGLSGDLPRIALGRS